MGDNDSGNHAVGSGPAAGGADAGPGGGVVEDNVDDNVGLAHLALGQIPPDQKFEGASYLLGGLTQLDQAQAVTDLVSRLPDAAKAATASNVFDQLGQPQKAAQVMQGIESLSAPDLEQAVGAGLNRLPAPQLESAASAALGALSPDAQQRVTGGLTTPDAATNRWLWKVVVVSLVAVVIVFGVLTFVLILKGKSAEAPLALATTALGGIVGLLSPGPATKGSN